MWLYVPEQWNDSKYEYKDKINILDVCAGSGMFGFAITEALQTFGLQSRTLVHIEKDAQSAAACVGIEKAAGGEAAVWDDIATFDGAPWRGIIDVVCAGLPCPAFSVAGKSTGNKDNRAWGAAFNSRRRHTWGPQPHFLRILAEIKPELVFFENVPQWVSAGHFAIVGETLSRLDYEIKEPVFLSSADVGATHQRERVFVLAYAGSQGLQASKLRRTPAKKTCTPRPTPQQCKIMGNAEYLRTRARAAGLKAQTRQWRDRFTNSSDRLGLYPPGRNEYDKWDDIAQLDASRMPAIESGVPVVADGLAFSCGDLLRIGGNGVDPMVAAMACRILLSGIFDE